MLVGPAFSWEFKPVHWPLFHDAFTLFHAVSNNVHIWLPMNLGIACSNKRGAPIWIRTREAFPNKE